MVFLSIFGWICVFQSFISPIPAADGGQQHASESAFNLIISFENL
jgi:hypothetical protein